MQRGPDPSSGAHHPPTPRPEPRLPPPQRAPAAPPGPPSRRSQTAFLSVDRHSASGDDHGEAWAKLGLAAAVAPLALVLSDTAAQQWAHQVGYNDLGYGRAPVVAAIDGTVAALSVAGLALASTGALEGDGGLSQGGLARHRNTNAVTGLLLSSLTVRAATALYRRLCWRASCAINTAGSMPAAQSLRQFALWSMVLTYGALNMYILVVELFASNLLRTGSEPFFVLGLFARQLGAAGTEDEFWAAAASGAGGAWGECLGVASVERGGETRRYDAPGAGAEVRVYEGPGFAVRVFQPEGCVASGSQAVASPAGLTRFGGVLLLGAMLVHQTENRMLAPVSRLVTAVIDTAERLDDKGMLAGEGQPDQRLEAPQAFLRLRKALGLLVQVSAKGKHTLAHILAQGEVGVREHNMGIGVIYGMDVGARGARQASLRTPSLRVLSEQRSMWGRDRTRPNPEESRREGGRLSVARREASRRSVARPEATREASRPSVGRPEASREASRRSVGRPEAPPGGKLGGARSMVGSELLAAPTGLTAKIPFRHRSYKRPAASFNSSTSGLAPASSRLAEQLDEFREATPDLGHPSCDILSMSRAEYPLLILAMFKDLGLVDLEAVARGRAKRPPPSAGPSFALSSRAGGSETGSGSGRQESGRQGSGRQGSGGQGSGDCRGSWGGDRLSVTAEVLQKFVAECEVRYQDNPYHRWEHAVDVTHSVYMYVRRARGLLGEALGAEERFAMMVAAIAHDMGHRGVSNAHLIKTSDLLAVTYNDASPQENMHVSALFQLCEQNPEADVFEGLTSGQFERVRKLIIELVLDSDMTMHFNRVSELELVLERLQAARAAAAPAEARVAKKRLTGSFKFGSGDAGPAAGADDPPPRGGRVAPEPAPVALSPEDARTVLMGLFHAADLGNCVKPVHLHVRWSLAVNQEFFREARIQKELGIEPVPFMDPDQSYCPSSQMDFMDFIARPLFAVLARILPGECSDFVTHLRHNFQYWGSLVSEDKLHRSRLLEEGAALRGRATAEGPSGGEGRESDKRTLEGAQTPSGSTAGGTGSGAHAKWPNLHVAVPQHGELAPGGELEYLDGDRVLLAALTREVRETGVRFPPEALLSLDVAERVSLFYDRTAQHGRADRSRSSSQLPRRDKKASKVSSMGSGRRNAGARGTDA